MARIFSARSPCGAVHEPVRRAAGSQAGAQTAPGRCRFPGKSATASACFARSAISCCMSTPGAAAACSPPSRRWSLQSDGRGWARNTVGRLCIDVNGRVSEPCTRDNVKESYLTPVDHPVTVRLTGPVPVGATCAWTFDDGDGPQSSTFDCAEPVNLRVRYGRTTAASVDVTSAEGNQRVATEIAVRDIFIAGLGDSIASGEGNPDRPIALSDEGFCFRYYLSTRDRAVLPAEPRRLQGRPRLRGAGGLQVLAAPERLLVQPGLPPLALQLPDPHRAAACRAISAHRGDLSAARLHRRHHRRRPVRLAALSRMPAVEIEQHLSGHGERTDRRIARGADRGKAPPARAQARPRAAVDRRQRHLFLRPRRRRHRRLYRPSACCSSAAA